MPNTGNGDDAFEIEFYFLSLNLMNIVSFYSNIHSTYSLIPSTILYQEA